MSHQLWKYYFEDDAESFCQLLGEAGVAGRSTTQKSFVSEPSNLNVGSLGGVAHSPGPRVGVRPDTRHHTHADGTHSNSYGGITLTRADINRRDGKGLTLLHHAASSASDNAKSFALALIAHSLIDLHAQDFENGWTALHRAFYFGNITIARAILGREAQDAVGTGGLSVQAASLIKTKDWEGNGPYDLLTATIGDRTLHHSDPLRLAALAHADPDEEEAHDTERWNGADDAYESETLSQATINLDGDELLTFGSNKNITLGLGNQDDRQFPERVSLKRPDHLFRRFHRDHVERRVSRVKEANPQFVAKIRSSLGQRDEISELPAIVRSIPMTLQDVYMSKFHTAVLTNDPVSNLYICGHGFGGRLGVGDEKTRFNFVCVEDFGSTRQNIVAVALGQDHTLAVTRTGGIFAWGSNEFGQLGLGLSKTSVNAEEPHQLVPKQLFGPVKREVIVGVAASRIHSVAHTTTALYTFGKNEGQLGVVDAGAASLKVVPIPRRVAASRFSCEIASVCATDRATICLLESHEVHVFANYGIVKLQFPLDQFANPLSEASQTATRYDDFVPRITKVTCGGDTICALSNAGEIFAVTVDQRLDPGSSSTTSTTNPNKIRDALSQPLRIWSLKKGHMSARDVAVDQDGSIIIATEAGGVWRRMRRAAFAKTRFSGPGETRSKEFKISRVPGLTRVIAVRASGSGAYSAVRSECDVTQTQIPVSEPTLWSDLATLLPFKNLAGDNTEESKTEQTKILFPERRHPLQALVRRMVESKDLEKEMDQTLRYKPNEFCSNLDVLVGTSVSDVKIPAHAFILSSRSRYLRDAFAACRRGSEWADDLLTISSASDGRISLLFRGLDFLSVVEFLLYAYTDQFVGFWLMSRNAPQLAYRYRQVRLEVLKIANRFDLQTFESAVRRMAHNAPLCLDKDLDMAVAERRFFEDGNASVQLQDAEISIHTDLLSRRCPFFEGLFQGRAGGRWLEERLGQLASPTDNIGVDLTHVELHVFQLVLRYIYADVGEELFDEVATKDLDEFLDLVLDVLSVANELMLDRLSQVCQHVLGRYVNTRNVCQLLNAVAPSSVTEFKDSALEFICLNLEGMLSNHLLDELDEDLLHELDDVVQDNQLNSLPFAKSDRPSAVLHDKYPQLAETIMRDRLVQLDWMRVHAKHSDQHSKSFGASYDPNGDDLFQALRSRHGSRKPSTAQSTPKTPVVGSVKSPSTDNQTSAQRDKPTALTPTSPFSRPQPPSYQDQQSALSQTPDLGPPQLDLSSVTPTSTTTTALQTPPTTHATPSSPSAAPWGALPLSSGKLGMKEIMDQASSSRTSNLSLGFAREAKSDERAAAPFQMKMSQKERRRQLQRQQTDEVPDPTTAAEPSSSSTPASPWQTATSKSKASVPPARNPNSTNESLATPPTIRSTTTPQLTMRQTVANSSSTSKKKESPTTQPPQTPTAQRSVSTPQSSSAKANAQGMASSTTTSPMEIQSIRHVPQANAEVSPTFRMHQSLADILSQQQAEKNVVKEAVAKRSLQEIQQEQEFQAWWDQESKRVMDEEAAAAARAVGSRGRGGGARGGRSRTRRARGKEKGKGAEKEPAVESTPQPPSG